MWTASGTSLDALPAPARDKSWNARSPSTLGNYLTETAFTFPRAHLGRQRQHPLPHRCVLQRLGVRDWHLSTVGGDIFFDPGNGRHGRNDSDQRAPSPHPMVGNRYRLLAGGYNSSLLLHDPLRARSGSIGPGHDPPTAITGYPRQRHECPLSNTLSSTPAWAVRFPGKLVRTPSPPALGSPVEIDRHRIAAADDDPDTLLFGGRA